VFLRLAWLALFLALPATPGVAGETAGPIRVLIVDGFSNHDWRLTTRSIRAILEPTGLFSVDVSTSPPDAAAPGWDSWRPDFAAYDVVIQTCNDINGGPSWPRPVREAFAAYVRNGGGVYVWHSGNNAFPDWPAYNDLIGIGWRKKDAGPALVVSAEGKVRRIPAGQGEDTGHGPRFDALVQRLGDHPIHRDLPRAWRAADIEVYHHVRGPAKNVQVLSYAHEPHTQLNWPIEWTVRHGRGRVYTSTLGHVWRGDVQPVTVRDAGVQTLLVRALQWLSRRPVSWPVPGDFPTAAATSVRGELALPVEPVQTWTPDNGNGTFTNPLFYEEFSDPDLIRVGDDFYLTGTTMHSMPGLPVLHSKDLVNWRLLSYAMQTLDLGPGFRLENGQNIYGQGIWAPSFRHHDGTFYIFSNVNRQTTQVFTARDPAGPWQHRAMKRALHDLSVLFDDDGKVYVVWGYRGIKFAQLNEALDDIVPGTEREIIPEGAGMGEGLHFYKIDGKYLLLSAWYADRMRMPAARADKPEGPYEVNQAISIDEDFGLPLGNRLTDAWGRTQPLVIKPGDPHATGKISLHQGGIVQTPLGEWWGFSMIDANSVGRLTALSPITWQDGWPYFGLPGNLTRNPRTWVKPRTAEPQPIRVPYTRNDDFSGPALANVWQWNHVPVNDAWSLTARSGHLRLNALPADTLWNARNTLTQRAIGPRSSPVAVLDVAALRDGDSAGLALFNRPYAWLGVQRVGGKTRLVQFDEHSGRTESRELTGKRVWLRADCDFITEQANFSYSLDGRKYLPFGKPFTMVFQLATFQGVRYSLFAFNSSGARGGAADFDSFEVLQPDPRGLLRPIPFGRKIRLDAAGRDVSLGEFEVVNMKLGRVALKRDQRWLSIAADGASGYSTAAPGNNETFQWMETPNGDLVLLSLATHRYLRLEPDSGKIVADSPGPLPDGSDGVRFRW
jgi:xylan 1,4-beta-xylosidase